MNCEGAIFESLLKKGHNFVLIVSSVVLGPMENIHITCMRRLKV